MSNTRRRMLRIALVLTGAGFLAIGPLVKVWPSGWAWSPGLHEYEWMIVGVYATLGAFLFWASRDPEAHVSLIWFTVASSAVHGGIMAALALADPARRSHLGGDVAGAFLVAIVLGALAPRRARGEGHAPRPAPDVDRWP